MGIRWDPAGEPAPTVPGKGGGDALVAELAPTCGGLAQHASSRMMPRMNRKMRRAPQATLDDAIERFERGLRQLALDLARTEIDRLRNIPWRHLECERCVSPP